jgi:ABC-2 type transport system ATP-binding protein
MAIEIAAEKLTKAYGSFLAVDGISFEVPKGQIVGFLGPNGAGKTTTIRMLTCYLPPTSGRASVAGHDVFFDSLKVREKIGYLPENTPLYTEMRVEEYLQFKAKLRGLDKETRKRRIEEVLEKCWLKERRRSLISALSKGYRQRVGIADTLLHNPPVLVLDEPTVGLDPSQVVETRKLFAGLAHHHTVLLSSHILGEVEKVCQRVIIIARGKIVAQGTPAELAQRGGEGLRVTVRGPAPAVQQALAALQGVDRVTALDAVAGEHAGLPRFAIGGKTTPELRERIANRIIQGGWGLCELAPQGESLESFFVRVTDPAGNRVAAEA